MATVANTKGSALETAKQRILDLLQSTQSDEIVTVEKLRSFTGSSAGILTKALQMLSTGKSAKIKPKQGGYYLLNNKAKTIRQDTPDSKTNATTSNVLNINRAQEIKQGKRLTPASPSPKNIESAIRAIATELSKSKMIAELLLLEKLNLNEDVFKAAIEKLRELDAIAIPDFEGFEDSIITPKKTISEYINYVDESIVEDEFQAAQTDEEDDGDLGLIESIASSRELAIAHRSHLYKGKNKKEIYKIAIDNSVFNLLKDNTERITVSGIAKSIEGTIPGIGSIGRPAIIERVGALLESGYLEIYKEGELTRDFYRLTKKSKGIEINHDLLISPKNPPAKSKKEDANDSIKGNESLNTVKETQLELNHLGGDNANDNIEVEIEDTSINQTAFSEDPFSRIISLTNGLKIQNSIMNELDLIKSMIDSKAKPTEDQLTEFIARKLAQLLLK